MILKFVSTTLAMRFLSLSVQFATVAMKYKAVHLHRILKFPNVTESRKQWPPATGKASALTIISKVSTAIANNPRRTGLPHTYSMMSVIFHSAAVTPGMLINPIVTAPCHIVFQSAFEASKGASSAGTTSDMGSEDH